VFVIDEEQAPCEGFELGVKKMKKYETALITVDAKYAFGESGNAEKKIPPNVPVQYEVKLMDFVKGPEPWDMEPPQKIETATAIKEKGNAAFKAGKNDKAAKLWERSLKFVEFDDSFDADCKPCCCLLEAQPPRGSPQIGK
jgi:FKBP-type peptidyl-prolyl cis-trans isomerase